MAHNTGTTATDLIQFDPPQISPSTSAASSPSHAPHSRASAPSKHVDQWSVEEVCGFLAQQGLSEYVGVFRSNAIDGEELVNLDDNSMKSALKMGELNLFFNNLRK